MNRLVNILFIVGLFMFNTLTSYAQGNDKIIELGFNAFEKEQYTKAIDFFTKVISPIGEDDGVNYSPYEVRANIHKVERNDFGVILPPEDPTDNEIIVIHKLAECYQKINDYQSSEIWFKKAIDYPKEEFPYSRYFYAETLMKNHKYDTAKIHFEKFITVDIVNKQNKFYKLAKSKLTSCEYANDLTNTNEVFSVEQSDSVLNFSAVSYAMQEVNPKLMVFSATASNSGGIIYRNPEDVDLLGIYLAHKNTDGTIKDIEKLASVINTSGRHQGASVVSPNGKRIYFTRVNPNNRADTKIYFSEKKNNTWVLPKPMNNFVNYNGFKSLDPYLTKDGKFLFFASNMPGGEGGMDIWVAELDKNGKAINQQNLGWNVNTPEDELSPFEHESTKAIYFSSDGMIGFGGRDIFMSKWNYNTDWYKKAINIGAPVNSSRDDSHFTMDKNLVKGYLTSDRDRCENCDVAKTRIEFCNKLYQIKKEVLNFVIEGYVFDEETSLPLKNAVVEFKDISHAKEDMLVETDENGYYKLILEPETDYFIKASLINYFADQALISTVDEIDSKTFRQNFYLKPIPSGEITIEGIEYDYNKATLRPSSIVVLDELIEFLELNSNLNIEIRSHTDYRGTDSYNLRLSEARAKSVVDYLIDQGIEGSRLRPKGYGENEPAEIQFEDGGEVVTLSKRYIDNLSTKAKKEEAHQRNRRTAFKVTGQ